MLNNEIKANIFETWQSEDGDALKSILDKQIEEGSINKEDARVIFDAWTRDEPTQLTGVLDQGSQYMSPEAVRGRVQQRAAQMETETILDAQAAIDNIDLGKSSNLFKLQELADGNKVKIGNKTINPGDDPEIMAYAKEKLRTSMPSEVARIEKDEKGRLTYTDKSLGRQVYEDILGRENVEALESPDTGLGSGLLKATTGALSAPSRALGSLVTGEDMAELTTSARLDRFIGPDVAGQYRQQRQMKLDRADDNINNLYQKELAQRDPNKRAQIRRLRQEAQVAKQQIQNQMGGMELTAEIGSAGISDPLTFLDAPYAAIKGAQIAGDVPFIARSVGRLADIGSSATQAVAPRVTRAAQAAERGIRKFEGPSLVLDEAQRLGRAAGGATRKRVVEPIRQYAKAVRGTGASPTQASVGAAEAAAREAFVYAPEQTSRDVVDALVINRNATEAVLDEFAGTVGQITNALPERLAATILDFAGDGAEEIAKRVPEKYSKVARNKLKQGMKARDLEELVLGEKPVGVQTSSTLASGANDLLGREVPPIIGENLKEAYTTVTSNPALAQQAYRAITGSNEPGSLAVLVDEIAAAEDMLAGPFKLPASMRRAKEDLVAMKEQLNTVLPQVAQQADAVPGGGQVSSGLLDELSAATAGSKSEEIKDISQATWSALQAAVSKGANITLKDVREVIKRLDNEINAGKVNPDQMKKLRSLRKELRHKIKFATQMKLPRRDSPAAGTSSIVERLSRVDDILKSVGDSGLDLENLQPREAYLKLADLLTSQTALRESIIDNVLKTKQQSGYGLNLDDFERAKDMANTYMRKILNAGGKSQGKISDITAYKKLKQLDEATGTDFAEKMEAIWSVTKYAKPVKGADGTVSSFKLPMEKGAASKAANAILGNVLIIDKAVPLIKGLEGLVKVATMAPRTDLGTTQLANAGVLIMSGLIKAGLTPNILLDYVSFNKVPLAATERVMRYYEAAKELSKGEKPKQPEKMPANISKPRPLSNLSLLGGGR